MDFNQNKRLVSRIRNSVCGVDWNVSGVAYADNSVAAINGDYAGTANHSPMFQPELMSLITEPLSGRGVLNALKASATKIGAGQPRPVV